MQTRYFYLLTFFLAFSDLILINGCFFLGFHLAVKYSVSNSPTYYYHNIVTANLLWLICASLLGLYSKDTICKVERIYRATWKSVALHGALFLLYLFLMSHTDRTKSFLLFFYLLMVVGFLLSRFIGTAFEDALNRKFPIRKPIAVLGMNRGGVKLAAYLESQSAFSFAGFLDDEGLCVDSEGELLSQTASQFQNAAQAGIQDVFVSLTPDRMGEVGNLLKEAEKQCVRLKFVPDLNSTALAFNIEHMSGFSILSVRKEPLESIENRFKKRSFDICFSLLVIICLLSWLYPILALLIKLQSPGPILFKQQRSGRDNRTFWCYKFRSMKMNGSSDAKQASKNDDRITPIGNLLRKTSLDELPQFFNVLFGNMSVVGPRPHMLNHTEEYRAIIDQYMVRQFVKPGITGWAQINGYRGETREIRLMEARVEHDIWYMENWSAMLDVKIIFTTVINIFRGEENAY